MSNPSAVQILRKPVRSLQEACASLLAVKRAHPAGNVKSAAKWSAAAGPLDDDAPTQWSQTNWSDTNFEPRLP